MADDATKVLRELGEACERVRKFLAHNVPASRDNKERLNRWLSDATRCVNDLKQNPSQHLERAKRLLKNAPKF